MTQSELDNISDPTKIPGSAVFNPANLNDEELQYFINSAKNSQARNGVSSNPTQASQFARQNQIVSNLVDEQNKRNQAKATTDQASQIQNLFAGTGGGGANDFSSENSAQNQRNAIDQIFGNQRDVQTQNLNNVFNQQRGNAIDEAAALGTLRQPGFQTSVLNNIDAQKSQAMAQLLGTLGAGQGQARSGLESDISNRALQGQQLGLQRAGTMAGLLQGNNQFGQTFGLQQNQFNAGQRQQNLENLFNQNALDQAGQLGQLQANAQKKTGWDQFGQIAGGIGGLAGGFGGLAGGVAGLANSGLFSPKPKPTQYGYGNQVTV